MRHEQGVKFIDSGLHPEYARLLDIDPNEYVIVEEANKQKFHIVIGGVLLQQSKGCQCPCVKAKDKAIQIAKSLNQDNGGQDETNTN